MAGTIALYRAKTGRFIHELHESGGVGIEKAREWCQELAEQHSTVDLYFILVDGTEVFSGSFVHKNDPEFDMPSHRIAPPFRGKAQKDPTAEGSR